MEEIELRSLILRGEDTTLEFKSKAILKDTHDLAAECVAFLNRRGGTLLIGVDDDGEINGFAPEELEYCASQLRSMAKDKISPPVMIDTENVVTQQGIVVMLQLDEGVDKPYQTTKGGAFYIRSGDEKRHVSHRDELRCLFQIGAHVFAEKKVLPRTRIDQVSLAAYRDYYENRFKEDALPDDDDLIDQMRSLHLLQDNQLTVAGCLLFGKQPEHLLPEFGIKAVWFTGTESSSAEFRDQRPINGGLRECYEQISAFLDAWNTREQPEGGSYNDNGEPRVDPRVFEELLTNALVHRDYFIRDSIKVFIFDDRIEISSPGTLPNSLSLAEAKNGIRRSRNPIIEEIGQSLMQYKGHGTGLKRALKLCPGLDFDNNVEKNAFIAVIPV